MIMKLGNVNIDDGSNILAKNRDSPRSNEGVIFLSTLSVGLLVVHVFLKKIQGLSQLNL